MKYISTAVIDGMETVVVSIPLESMIDFDAKNPHQNTYAVPDDVEDGWVKQSDGSFAPPKVESKSSDQIIADYKQAAQKNLDDYAQSWNYDGIVSAASYSASTNPQFKAEALALIAWRDSVWASAYALLDEVNSGKKTVPKSVDEFLEFMPKAPDRPGV